MALFNNNISLPAYCLHLGEIDECGMWGVHYEGQESVACGVIWTLEQRRKLLQYLSQAQLMVEDKISYSLSPKWVSEGNAPYGTPSARSRHGTSYILMNTKKQHLIVPGVPKATLIESETSIDYTDDPAEIGPFTVPAGTTLDDLVVTHPGTQTPVEFDHDLSVINTLYNQAVLFIPRCRLVETAKAKNPPEGWDYSDDNNFESVVDVWTVTNDPSTQGVLVWPSGNPITQTIGETLSTAAIVMLNPLHGYVKVIPGTYSGTVWERNSGCLGCCSVASHVRLNYKAGLPEMPVLGQDAVIRLAHSMMPEGPCGCDIAEVHWKRDRNVPNFVAPERMRVPWGFSDGAWAAWQWANLLQPIWVTMM